MKVSYQQQLDCVKREIKMRERVYPRWVEAGRMTQDKADRELEAMRAVGKTLESMAYRQKKLL